MKIGIDISQIAYGNTGVSNYLLNLVQNLLNTDQQNEYILFYSSLRKKYNNQFKLNPKTKVKLFNFPPTLLDFLWNKLHKLPIENLIGDIDIFITSDWTEPPTNKAKKATILYDLIVYKNPEETDNRIIKTQKSKLEWVKRESKAIFCISESTKKDAKEILGINEDRLYVSYPGF